MLNQFKHIQARRADLRRSIDIEGAFQAWEETCVPSYCHRNLLAAYVSWWRLFGAVQMARRNQPQAKRALDFGSSVGELGHLLAGNDIRYEFVEADTAAASFLKSRLPDAVQHSLEGAPDASYDLIFAIDSLEHNNNYAELLRSLTAKLAPEGILVLSGPTENQLYRLGRRIAGFDAHYHVTTIYHIEEAAATMLTKRDTISILPAAPLFRISAWSRRNAG